jgi:alpha-beta hydrolase superfamily lysophospholipase
MDFSIKVSKSLVLRGLISSPGEKMRAVIIFVHGLGEHLHRYSDWFGSLAKEGIGFTGVDLPGHGLSDGKRGHINSFAVTDEMIDIIHDSVKKTFPGIPVFFYGHSLGGGIVLDYIIRRKPGIRGAIITSPWLRLSFQPGKAKLLLASITKNILPGLIQPSGLVVEHISHDEEVVRKYKTDPLVHDRISVALFDSAMKAGKHTLEHASELKTPLLLMHGTDDRICSPEGSRLFASASELVELKMWEGGFHELHNEFFKKDVFTSIIGWVNKKIN